jgi:hypothetical protein
MSRSSKKNYFGHFTWPSGKSAKPFREAINRRYRRHNRLAVSSGDLASLWGSVWEVPGRDTLAMRDRGARWFVMGNPRKVALYWPGQAR